jgi:hypothetical protein
MSAKPPGETRAKKRENRQGGGAIVPLSGGDERSEPESAKITYHLKPPQTFRHVPKLDSSGYSGSVVYHSDTSEHTAPAAERGGAAPAGGAGLSNGHIQSLLATVRQQAQVEIWRGGSLVHCQREKEYPAAASSKRGTVHGFSRKSRSRMMAMQGKIRWNPEKLPYFMGNTCPDKVPDPKHVIAAWAKFNRRFERRFPDSALIWRKEIKDRKSGTCLGEWVPHYHSFAYNCPRKFEYQEERGEWVKVHQRKDGGWTLDTYCRNEQGQKVLRQHEELRPGTSDLLPEWWSRNWYEAMGSGEWNHFQAGASFEQIRTIEGVRYYTSKYMAKIEEAGESPHCKGRWWGMVGRKNIPWAERVVIACTDQEAIAIMRVCRGYVLRKAKRKFRCNHTSMNYLVTDPAQWERFVAGVLAMRNVPF